MSVVLPILERREEIEAAIRAHRVVVLCGETGSGKTTQLPQICFAMGLAERGMIGHTQPRRLAARAVAARIAEERGERLGGVVGVKIRFQDQTSRATRLKIMTDGILLVELASDADLRAYSTIIIDEAHERSLNIDFILGYLKRLLARRSDLNVIVTSATIDPRRFSDYFGGPAAAPVIEVSGRTYPVEVRYRPTGSDEEEFERLEVDAVVDAVDELTVGPPGDVLVFLPGEREIRLAGDALRRRGVDAEVLPLFSRLTNEEQDRIFHPGGCRRVILATNVAETSLTVPGIRCVVDAGYARIKRYDPQRKIQRLPIEPISRASANQRAGRCGRVAAGVCVRLFSEESYRARPAFTDPEIRRTSLASVILSMKSLTLGPIEDFPFLDAPDEVAVRDGYETLFELGAIDGPTRDGAITEIGERMSRIPADPRIARMLLAAEREGVVKEVLVLAAVLSIQDPRQRPMSRQDESDRAQAVFRHESSDFMTLLKLWDQYVHAAEAMTHGALQGWCRDHFLSAARMREWGEMIRQLRDITEEIGIKASESGASEDRVHRALLTGLITNVACREGDSGSFEYRGVRGNTLSIFPGSVLFKKGPKWIMAAEVTHTTRLYARTLAKIDPEWIEELAGHMFRHQLSDRHLDTDTGEPSAWERVTMSGIVVVPRRRTAIARLDPAGARELFVREGLAQMKWKAPHPFMEHNRAVMEHAREAEARLRRRHLLVAEDVLAEWFEQRLPAHVKDPASFEEWRRASSDGGPETLRLSLTDVLRPEARGAADESLFPASRVIDGATCAVGYALSPGKEDDGVTLSVPLLTLPGLTREATEWLVPGMLADLVQALVRTLPKVPHAALESKAPLADVGAACAQVMRFGEGSVGAALSEAVDVLYGVRVEPTLWSFKALPPHLRLRVRVVDDAGRELGNDRDLEALRTRFEARVDKARSAAARARFERRGITAWDFGDLPERATVERAGEAVLAFPVLEDAGDSVALTLCDSERVAAATTPLGVRRLFALACADEVGHSLSSMGTWADMVRQYAALGDAGALRDDLTCMIADRVFVAGQSPVRSAAEFEQRSREMWGRLGTASREVGDLMSRLLEARHRVAQRFSGGTPRLWADSVADMREHAAYLMPRGFMRRITWERFRSYPRYVEALRDRLLALREDGSGVEKESLRRLMPRWKRFTGWVAAAMSAERDAAERASEAPAAPVKAHKSKAPLPQARRAAPAVNLDAGEWAMRPGALPPSVERYRWALEDWRVVLFAPERAAGAAVGEAELDALWNAVEGTKAPR